MRFRVEETLNPGDPIQLEQSGGCFNFSDGLDAHCVTGEQAPVKPRQTQQTSKLKTRVEECP
jgi:hypothetical protein